RRVLSGFDRFRGTFSTLSPLSVLVDPTPPVGKRCPGCNLTVLFGTVGEYDDVFGPVGDELLGPRLVESRLAQTPSDVDRIGAEECDVDVDAGEGMVGQCAGGPMGECRDLTADHDDPRPVGMGESQRDLETACEDGEVAAVPDPLG